MTEERSVSRSSPVPKVEMPLRMPRISSLLSHPSELEFGMRSWLSSSRAPWSRMSLSFPLLHVSVIALLVLFSFLLNPSKSAVAPGLCSTHDLPNPIASEFPNNATGVLNATLAIVPIPLEAARRIIPSRYTILEHAYREILPNFPEGMYPLLVQAAHDHDVQMRAFGFAIDDFSVGQPISSLKITINQLHTHTHTYIYIYIQRRKAKLRNSIGIQGRTNALLTFSSTARRTRVSLRRPAQRRLYLV